MKLSEILNGIDTISKYEDMPIGTITNNSRNVENGDVYVAIRGTAVDGHSFAKSAVDKGAAAVIVDHDMSLPQQIIVSDTRQAYAVACANYFDNPCQKIKLIGVTGTNGKTSVTTMVKHILEYVGLKTGLIGTMQIEYGTTVKETQNTTPDAFVLHQTLADMVVDGCDFVVMEVSSHALVQERLYGCRFKICAFTNLTQDHLDYHKTMEEYYNAKKKLFSMGECSIINTHNDYGKRLLSEIGGEVITFSVNDGKGEVNADFIANDIVCTPNDVDFRVVHDGVSGKVSFAIPGIYSVENALTAISICFSLGVSFNKIITALGQIQSIKGRSEIIYTDDSMTIICDYAHSPDGIENILSSIRDCSTGRIVTLFGCGGDRDMKKRPLMAAACEKYSDFIVVTSDNPRSEVPEIIIEDILKGFSERANYVTITDRREAIEYTIKNAKLHDTILLLGKGHEDYQVTKNGKIHFDEREIVAEIIQQL